MLTDDMARSRATLALRVPNTLAGWCDLRNLRPPGAATQAAGRGSEVSEIYGEDFGFIVRGKAASLHQDGALICAAAGVPGFESNPATDVAGQYGAAAGWLELYRQFGADLFGKARGAWSVVLLDRAKHQVIAGVDRFAIRPLCFQQSHGVLAFASRADEIPGSSDEIDPQAVFDYVYHHFIPAPRTIFRDISRLDAAHRIVATTRAISIDRHWQPRFEPQQISFRERREAFLSGLTDAVSDQLGNESVGCYLSGGTDSSTITGMAARITGKPVKTFSIGFDAAGYDEMHFARVAARHFGTDHHEYYVTARDIVERLREVAVFYDQPFGNSSALPAYLCARLASETGVTRMLAGDGGDELFGGNSRYAKDKLFTAYERIPDRLKRSLIEPLALVPLLRSIPVIRKGARYVEIARMPVPGRLQLHNLLMRMGPESVFAPEFLAQVDIGEPHRRELATFAAIPSGSTLDRTLAYEWKYILADNDLPKVTGAAALGGVEAAFPMLDDRLVDFSLALPVELKVRGPRLRHFFKEALRGFLPREIIAKKKHGFGLPFGVWVRETPELRDLARGTIDSLERRGLIRTGLGRELFDARIGEHAGYYGEMIWVLTILEHWLDRQASTVHREPHPSP